MMYLRCNITSRFPHTASQITINACADWTRDQFPVANPISDFFRLWI